MFILLFQECAFQQTAPSDLCLGGRDPSQCQPVFKEYQKCHFTNMVSQNRCSDITLFQRIPKMSFYKGGLPNSMFRYHLVSGLPNPIRRIRDNTIQPGSISPRWSTGKVHSSECWKVERLKS